MNQIYNCFNVSGDYVAKTTKVNDWFIYAAVRGNQVYQSDSMALKHHSRWVLYHVHKSICTVVIFSVITKFAVVCYMRTIKCILDFVLIKHYLCPQYHCSLKSITTFDKYLHIWLLFQLTANQDSKWRQKFKKATTNIKICNKANKYIKTSLQISMLANPASNIQKIV